MPSQNQHDPNYRRLRYCRYADDFLLGVSSSKEEAEEIYRKIQHFLTETLRHNTSKSKSGLKHQTEVVRFLGYDLMIRNTERVIRLKTHGQHTKMRSLKGQIALLIPEAKLKGFADKHGYGNWEPRKAIHRPLLLHLSDAEITLFYSAEMRGIVQYYALANNYRSLGKLRILWIESYLKTMAHKHQMSMQQVATMLHRGSYMAVRETDKTGQTREIRLFQVKSVKPKTIFNKEVENPPFTFQYTLGSELLRRMDANKCEYCEKEGGYFEVHHVRKLADIKNGREPWKILMIARQRKTLVLCIECHDRLTVGTLPDRRHLLK